MSYSTLIEIKTRVLYSIIIVYKGRCVKLIHFTMTSLYIEQICERVRIYARLRGAGAPWERAYAKQVIGTQYLFI